VKALRVEDGLVKELSHCLRLEDGEFPLELLPELQELTYFGSRDANDVFASFIDARQDAGHPVMLDRHSPSPSSLWFPFITLPSYEAGDRIELEPRLPHANYRVLHLFLGLLPTPFRCCHLSPPPP
jgi:hypothetical protein